MADFTLDEGQEAKLKVENIMWPYRDRYAPGVIKNEFNTYEGTVLYKKWFRPNEVGLTTGDPNFEFRVIQIERIVAIDGLERSKSQEQPLSARQISSKTFTIKGSTGSLYEVQVGGSQRSRCSCKGFEFRGNCRHLAEAELQAA